MTLLSPIGLQIIGYAALALGALTVLAYILKMRRRRFEVPFSTLWNRVLKEKEATSLWKYLRRLLSLLLALFILGLLLFASAEPRLGEADSDARNVIVILDTSASMKTVDEGPDGEQTRMRAAKNKALELLGSLGSGDSAMLMRMDGQTTPLSRFESDIPRLKRVLEAVEATDTPADLRRALGAAADALRERRNPMIVLIGDGAYPEDVLDSVSFEPGPPTPAAPPAAAGDDETARFAGKRLDVIDLSGVDVRYIPVGKKHENVGIVAFNVRRYISNKLSYEVFIEIQNFSDQPVERKLVLSSGTDPIDVKTITLEGRQRLRQIYPNLSGGDDTVLTASVEMPVPVPEGVDQRAIERAKHDAFALDDVAYALLPARRQQNVLLVTKDNLYLEGAMLVYDNITVDKYTPEEYEKTIAAGTLARYHAIVFDDYTPAPDKIPEGPHLLFFHPSGEHSPFPIASTLDRPRVTEINDNHPVMRWLLMDDVNFDSTNVFRVDTDGREVVLAQSIRSPMIAAKRDGQRKIVACGFSLASTDLMLRVAFPLLLVNTLDWFAGDDSDLITTYTTGEAVQVPMDGTFELTEVEIQTPQGKIQRAPLKDGMATFYASSVGVHALVAKRDAEVLANVSLAANLSDPEESDIAPSTELNMGGKALEPPSGFALTHSQSLWLYLAILVLVLLCVEWVTYNRRITV